MLRFLRKGKKVPQENSVDLASQPNFEIEVLSKKHDKTSFLCADDAITYYFRKQASQDVKRRMARCFVLVDKNNNNKVAGFYTLSADAVLYTELTPAQTKNLPRYKKLPAALVGRLGVDNTYRGENLGYTLLLHAEQKAKAADLMAFAITLDAMHKHLYKYYTDFGFTNYGDAPNKFIKILPKD